MRKVCYLHVGLHKTASTSFQQTCANNADALKQAGINYPIFECEAANKLKIQNHSIPIFSLFVNNPADYHVNKRWGVSEQIDKVNSSYMEQLERHLELSSNILISGEDISMLGEQAIERLIQTVEKYGYEIKATALIRSPYSMTCSQLQETIKGGKYNNLISLNDSVSSQESIQINGRANVVKKLKSIFCKRITFSSYERACSSQCGPVGYLLREYLNQDPKAYKYSRSNDSYYNLTVRFQNELNKINSTFTNKKVNPSHQRLTPEMNQNLDFSGKFLLTEREYELIKDFIRDETNALYELTMLDELVNQKIQFSKPIF